MASKVSRTRSWRVWSNRWRTQALTSQSLLKLSPALILFSAIKDAPKDSILGGTLLLHHALNKLAFW